MNAGTPPSGFSLVEVTLAIGIVSFGALSIVGLCTVSSHSLSETRNSEIGQTIFKSVSGALANTRYADLPNAERTYGFDLTGFPTDQPEHVIFQARIQPRTGSTFAGASFDETKTSVYRIDVFHAPGSQEINARPVVYSAPLVITRLNR